MINLPPKETPLFTNKFLYLPYDYILSSIKQQHTATQFREIYNKVAKGTTGGYLSELKLKYHEIHIVDDVTGYDSKKASLEPYDLTKERQIYYYVFESNPEVIERIINDSSYYSSYGGLTPIRVNLENQTMQIYRVDGDTDTNYVTTTVHLMFMKEDTFDEFPEIIKNKITDSSTRNIYLKPSEMPYVCHLCDNSQYITLGPKDKDCMVVISQTASFFSAYTNPKQQFYHDGSIFLFDTSNVYSFSSVENNHTGKNIIIGSYSNVYFSDLQDNVMIGRKTTVGLDSYIGKDAVIFENCKISTMQSVGPYQTVKTPYNSILGSAGLVYADWRDNFKSYETQKEIKKQIGLGV